MRSLLKDRLRGWCLIRNQCQRKGGIQDDVERSRLGKSGRENGSVCTKIIVISFRGTKAGVRARDF